jgi:outer membrane protein
MKTFRFALALAAAAALFGAAPTATPARAEEPTLGKQAGSFLIRGRVIGIIPMEHTDSISAGTLGDIGGHVSVSDQATPEVDFSYFVTDNIAFELIAATARHYASANGTAAGSLDALSTYVLPPTLTVQYHFMPKTGFSPYVGAGVNYTMFYDTKGSGIFDRADLDNSWGWALQAGMDMAITDRWFFNADIKQIFLNTKAKLYTAGLPPTAQPVTAKFDLNPMVIGVGVGYRF